ncbi:hypothetical protein GWI33_022256 [Rhynchophorus ferrugineus]|uniref:Post-GPI attachment to proteins factor 3 n=1 Tax=Rhynchophorus ferrugineus TaxID=354439 RepID=A0A834IUP3_RHYFE|nr:hypothetical protein GWI33_022256 [Rhynchophorus ferrugineus]
MWRYFIILSILIKSKLAWASIGDRSPYYQKCLDRCHLLNCTQDGKYFLGEYTQPLYLQWTFWYCLDECKYNCMWKTITTFHDLNLKTPQFYGKWPFIRFLGIQEPASMFFSLFNLYMHVKMLKIFQKRVRYDSPLYSIWISFGLICCNAWFWSAVFHTRDFLLTEIFDYIFSFSIILVNFYVMMIRVLRFKLHQSILIFLTILILAFFLNHGLYLYKAHFDYAYNMKINILVGTLAAICWFIWCFANRNNQPYVWKCALYVALTGLVLPLEIIDQPPLFYVFDFHAIWHLTTAPLVFLIYSFAIDDCRYLRKLHVEDLNFEGNQKSKFK